MEYALYRLLRTCFMPTEQIQIRRHRLSGLDVCDVTTDELDSIEREGGDLGLDFQIFQFCLTVAISVSVSLLSNKPESDRVFIVFAVVIVVAIGLAGIFGLKWWRSRGGFSRLIQKIRDFE